MARDIDQENSEVRTLILNTLQAEERAMESDQDSMDSRSEYDEMNATYDVNEKYNPENDDEQIRLMQVVFFTNLLRYKLIFRTLKLEYYISCHLVKKMLAVSKTKMII